MAGIIFENWPNTNWLNEDWARLKRKEIKIKEVKLLDDILPNASVKRKAQILGISYGYYYQLRRG